MKGFLIAFVLIAAVVAGLGFYMEWWSLSSSNTDNKVGISLTVDKDKLRTDTKTQDLGQQGNDKATEPSVQSTD